MARRVLGALAVTATATLATLALSTPAVAHTPKWDAKCDEGAKVTKLWVDLSAYVDRGKNTVVIKDGDKELLNKDFGKGYSQKWNDLDATVKHKFTIKVTSWDGFNYSDQKTVEPCVKTPPKPEQPKPEQPKPEQPKPEQPKPEQPPVVTTTEAPSSSVTPPPAPGGSTPEPPLAATGASPMWLLLSGLGLVGAGAGTLLFLRRRRSA